jgi:hypothetical protein
MLALSRIGSFLAGDPFIRFYIILQFFTEYPRQNAGFSTNLLKKHAFFCRFQAKG